jgi:hypothetical protein
VEYCALEIKKAQENEETVQETRLDKKAAIFELGFEDRRVGPKDRRKAQAT